MEIYKLITRILLFMECCKITYSIELIFQIASSPVKHELISTTIFYTIHGMKASTKWHHNYHVKHKPRIEFNHTINENNIGELKFISFYHSKDKCKNSGSSTCPWFIQTLNVLVNNMVKCQDEFGYWLVEYKPASLNCARIIYSVGKLGRMSSILNSQQKESLIVNGQMDNKHVDGISCPSTGIKNLKPNFFTVDLMNTVAISIVGIRQDTDVKYRLQLITIYYAYVNGFEPCANVTPAAMSYFEVKCEVVTRYVKVQKQSPLKMTLCQIEVYGLIDTNSDNVISLGRPATATLSSMKKEDSPLITDGSISQCSHKSRIFTIDLLKKYTVTHVKFYFSKDSNIELGGSKLKVSMDKIIYITCAQFSNTKNQESIILHCIRRARYISMHMINEEKLCEIKVYGREENFKGQMFNILAKISRIPYDNKTSKPKKKGTYIIFTILIVMIAGLVGFFTYEWYRISSKMKSSDTVPSSTY